jgi:hypothetical protein
VQVRRWGPLLAAPLVLAGCGGGSYSLARTSACLRHKGATVIKFPTTPIAEAAKGGGIEVWLDERPSNIGFGRTTIEARRLLRLYGSVGNPHHVRIYRKRNAVVAWDFTPPPQRKTVDACLRSARLPPFALEGGRRSCHRGRYEGVASALVAAALVFAARRRCRRAERASRSPRRSPSTRA